MPSRTISTAWVKGIVELLEGAGLDAGTLFSEAGLDIGELKRHDARFEPEKISTLWELAASRSGNPAIGLAMPEVAKPASFDAIAYVMMSCPNLLAALERLIRYLRIVSDAADIAVLEEDGGYCVSVALFGGARPVPAPRIEFVVVTILTFCRWLAGRELHLRAVDVAHPRPEDLQPYVAAFHCPLNFGADSYCLHFTHEDLLLPLPTSNPVLAELHDRYAGDYLSRLDQERIGFKVRELVIRRLPDGDPLRGDVAKELCMSERTLQRRLQEEGTSFLQLVDDTRRELAQQYLRQASLTLGQAAYLLGFADQSTFFRACKRWFGTSPGEYRTRCGSERR